MLWKSMLGRGNSVCKGQRVRRSLHSKEIKNACGARAEWRRLGRMGCSDSGGLAWVWMGAVL